jgi:hypothetical protein
MESIELEESWSTKRFEKVIHQVTRSHDKPQKFSYI